MANAKCMALGLKEFTAGRGSCNNGEILKHTDHFRDGNIFTVVCDRGCRISNAAWIVSAFGRNRKFVFDAEEGHWNKTVYFTSSLYVYYLSSTIAIFLFLYLRFFLSSWSLSIFKYLSFVQWTFVPLFLLILSFPYF